VLSLPYEHRCFHGIWWLTLETIDLALLFCCDFLTSARLERSLRIDFYGAFPITESDYEAMWRYPAALTFADYIRQDMWRHVANARMATRLRASLTGMCSLRPTVVMFSVWIVALHLLRLFDMISETTRLLAFNNVTVTLVVGTWTPRFTRPQLKIGKYALLFTATVLGTGSGLSSLVWSDEAFQSPDLRGYSAFTISFIRVATCYLSCFLAEFVLV
jgi:hypothetical protein